MKFGTVTQIGPDRVKTVKISNISKKQDGGGRHLENHTNRDITRRDRQIFAKFGMIMQNGSLKRPDR